MSASAYTEENAFLSIIEASSIELLQEDPRSSMI